MRGPDRQSFTDGYDEDREADGSPRPGYAGTLQALATVDLDRLARSVNAQLQDSGVSFGADPFVVDPVPRLIPAADGTRSRPACSSARVR